MGGVVGEVLGEIVPGRAAESDGAGTDAREPWAAGYYFTSRCCLCGLHFTRSDIFRFKLFWLLFCL